MKRMKLWVKRMCGSMAVVLTVSLLGASLPICAEEAGAEPLPVYVASEGFSDTQGKNGWSYYGWNQNKSNGVYQSGGTYRPTSDYKYKEADAAYVQNNTSGGSAIGKIWANKILPGVNTGSRVAAVRAYTVSEKGVVTIDANNQIIAEKQSATTVFQIKIRIRKNGTTIYPIDAAAAEEDKWEAMNNRQTASAFTPLENISVKQGDVITFEVIRATDTDASGTALTSTQMLDNAIYWDPVIRYTKVVPRKVIYSDNFSTVNEEFWRNRSNDWTVESGCLKNSGASSYIRFYAPHAVNYSMSFDLKFTHIDTETTSDQSGFFTMIRRGNGTQNFYRMRLDLRTSRTEKEIVSGVGNGKQAGFVSETKRDKDGGATPWQENVLYHVKESIETDGEKNHLTFEVTDAQGAAVMTVTRDFTTVFPAGGGGFLMTGNHQVEISNFVLEGEPSELKVDDTVRFYTDAELQTPAAADTLNGALYAAIRTTSGFSDDFSSKAMPRAILLAAYEADGCGGLRLKAIKTNRVYVTSATDTVSVSLDASEIAQGLTYRAFVWDGIEAMKPCAPVCPLPQTVTAESLNQENL